MPRIKYKKRPDGRYQARIYLGTENGKKKFKYLYASTVAELERMETEMRYSLHKGGDLFSGDLPFTTWAQRYLALKGGKVADVYYAGLQGRVNWWCAAVGDVPISKITRSDLQIHLDRLVQRNPHTRKPSSKKTLTDYRRTAAGVFELAITDRAINYNPADKLEISTNAAHGKRRALNDEEQQWILNTPHRAQTAALIMMLAGLRRGEVIPLQARDIDLDAGTITVVRTVAMVNGRPIVKDGGKSENAERVVNMPRALIEHLRPLLSGKSPFDLVITDTRGKLFSESAWKKMWESYLRDLNFKYGKFTVPPSSKFDPKGIPFVITRITPHMLRHTAATNMILAGMDAISVQAQLGHADIQTTLNIYTHVTAQHRQSQVSKLDAFLAARLIS